MKARSIGPAGMSGRIASIDAIASNPDIIFVGVSIGGVWKSTDGGVRWKPIFDTQPVSAIGAVSIFQPNPSIVWVGTGEGNPRNSASVGNGIYKSLDGGESWKHVGLERTERIHRIVLHPSNENVAFAAAMGQMWGENPDRGVFKTTDGGSTWRKVLYVNEKTGCADLVVDPNNPNKLFAAMWEYRRWPWFFNSGGPGSGLYVSYDAGETWKRLGVNEGLPAGDLGRIGVAASTNVPDVVYALVEATKSGLYRSDDGGRAWKLVNNSPNIASRPFYYADIRLDPQNENRLYKLETYLAVSNDGGKTFSPIATSIHVDHHALYIHPRDGSYLVNGNDGGLGISRDRGRTWRFVENLPVAQFYHINVDMETPYNIFGGMQDNGSWRGPSEVWESGGIRNWHWNDVGGGDGFAVLVDASDPNFGYGMSQGGALYRFNWKIGGQTSIRPWAPDGVTLRFNWNAGIAQDPFEPKTIYYGSQFLHKSTNRGDDWSIISPDLTTNDTLKQRQHESGGLSKDVTAAENHCTILTIAPSPLKQGVLWVGTDDGNVQLTTDGGASWSNRSPNITGAPTNTWVSHIEASKHDAGTAYVVFDDHRRSNWKTYLYRTTDYGRSWTSLTKNDPTAGATDHSQWGYALVVEEDPVNKNVLYLGTEFGLWISVDGGARWMKWTHGVPTASVMALIVHPREHDLVIGTHGRSAYVLDDIRPLRTANAELLNKRLHVFDIPPAIQHLVRSMDGYGGPGDAMFRGENRPYGALITYSINPPKEMLKDPSAGEPKTEATEELETRKRYHPDSIQVNIEVLDETGTVVRKFEDRAKRGINRTSWNLRTDGVRMPRIPVSGAGQRDERAPQGPEVLPGPYTIRLIAGKDTAAQTVQVIADPRVSISQEARKQKYDQIQAIYQRVGVASEAVDRIVKTRRAIDQTLELLRDKRDSTARALRQEAESLRAQLTRVADLFVDEPNRVQGITRNPKTVSALFGGVLGMMGSSWDAPTSTHTTYLRQANAKLEEALKEFNAVFSGPIQAFRTQVDTLRLSAYPAIESLNMDWKAKRPTRP
jgi:photosystem II stability/assembly factor-like uncharacterized protein